MARKMSPRTLDRESKKMKKEVRSTFAKKRPYTSNKDVVENTENQHDLLTQAEVESAMLKVGVNDTIFIFNIIYFYLPSICISN